MALPWGSAASRSPTAALTLRQVAQGGRARERSGAPVAIADTARDARGSPKRGGYRSRRGAEQGTNFATLLTTARKLGQNAQPRLCSIARPPPLNAAGLAT